MFRPYRYIPTDDLIRMRDKAFRGIQFNLEYGFTDLNGPARRELRRVSRELDRRSEETL